MLHHEKKAFLKFFITYFVSVAILIIVAGFFYFIQMKNNMLRVQEFSMITYAREIKMGGDLKKFTKDFSYTFLNKNKHIDIENFTTTENKFLKYIPGKFNKGYLKIEKSKRSFTHKLDKLAQNIILIQLVLLALFAYISYLLAKNALHPLEKSIVALDKFTKDLIHDLNTPVTAINLNIKLLERDPNLNDNNALIRLKKSVLSISELHENLTILLEEKTFQIQELNLCKILNEMIQTYTQLYPNIYFSLECSHFNTKVNANAIKQVLQNLISNACKYNSKNGYVKIYRQGSSLFIEDGGKGIKEPDKIFDRMYSDEHSSGIGLDIVKRLTQSMNIHVEVKTKEQGSIFILTMP